MNEIEERLEEIRERGLYRKLRCVSGPQGPRVLLDGRPVLLLCSNNYLGLADHPRVREAAAEAAMRYGAGAGASRLISGSGAVSPSIENTPSVTISEPRPSACWRPHSRWSTSQWS